MTKVTHKNKVFNASDFREIMQKEYEYLFKTSIPISSAFRLLNEDGWHVIGGYCMKRALAITLLSVIIEHLSQAHKETNFEFMYNDFFLGDPGGYFDGCVFWIEAESMCHYKIDGVIHSLTTGRIKLSGHIFNDDALLNELLDGIRKHIDDQVHLIASNCSTLSM